MNSEEMDDFACLIAEKLQEHERSCCGLSDEECGSVKELLKTKRNAVRVFIYIFGAIALYALKDLYLFIVGHLTIK